MSIECYFSACPNHDIHSAYPHPDMYAGPFCSQNECTATPMDGIKFQAARESEFQERVLTLVDDTFWFDILTALKGGDSRNHFRIFLLH